RPDEGSPARKGARAPTAPDPPGDHQHLVRRAALVARYEEEHEAEQDERPQPPRGEQEEGKAEPASEGELQCESGKVCCSPPMISLRVGVGTTSTVSPSTSATMVTAVPVGMAASADTAFISSVRPWSSNWIFPAPSAAPDGMETC